MNEFHYNLKNYEVEILNNMNSHLISEMSAHIRYMAKSYYSHILTTNEFSDETVKAIKEKIVEIDEIDKYEEENFIEQRSGEKTKDYLTRLHKRYFPNMYDSYGNLKED